MRLARALLAVLVLTLAGCAGDDGGPADATSTATPTPPPMVVEDVAPAHPLGITNQTPLVLLGAGSWDVTFEGKGTKQFVVRFAADMQPRGYSIGGELTILLVPVDFRFGACEPSEVNFLATATGGFSETWNNEVKRGDYLLVVDYQDDASGSFTWQVGESDQEQTLNAGGEPSPWTRRLVEPEASSGDFTSEVPAGFHFLTFRASTGLLTTSSRIHEEVTQAGPCHAIDEDGTISPLGGGASVALHTQSAAAVTWSGHFEAQAAGPSTGSTPSARGVVLSPPTIA